MVAFGFLLIKKPPGPTSHDLVDRIRAITGVRTVGHAGTLDPFASGLLIVGVGREATRHFPALIGLDKQYRAVIRLGATSDTDDRTGHIRHREAEGRSDLVSRDGIASPQRRSSGPAMTDIGTVLKKFTGKIEQVPPMYSAKKIGGKRLYELARKGKTVERMPSEVHIFNIQIASYSYPILSIGVHCSSGTYLRALARDIGEALGTGAYLEELERTAIGPFTLAEAIDPDALRSEDWVQALRPVEGVLDACRGTRSVLR